MVENNTDLAVEIVTSSSYSKIVAELVIQIKIKIVDGYDHVLANIDARSIALSGLDAQEIYLELETCSEDIIAYSVRKYKALHGGVDEQEYAIGEQPDEGDKDIIIKSKGYTPGFLIKNILEILLARKGISELEIYLKKSRIPKAKAYAKQIMSFM